MNGFSVLNRNRSKLKEAHNLATKTLYVGNLPYSINESQLASHFSRYGSCNVRIIEGRGFGFVDVDGESLEAAMADHGLLRLDGCTLTLTESRPRGEDGGSNSYGGGGISRR